MIIHGNSNNNVLAGTAYADTILGYEGADVLIGGGGNDILDGGIGGDTMDGGAGDDTYIVDFGLDKVVEYAGNGNDTIRSSIDFHLHLKGANVENLVLTGTNDTVGYGNELDNKIYGNSGDNNLYGHDGDDLIKGGDGRDYISGGAGDDDMYGGNGDDIFIVSDAGDTVTEYAGQGVDKVWAYIDWKLGANVENLQLSGIGGTSPNINGWGNELNNEIIGNAGNNYIDGGAGADIMKGGAGDDRYVVDNFFDQLTELAGEGIDHVYTSLSSFGLSTNFENLTLTGTLNSSGYGNSANNQITGNAGNNTLYGNGGDDQLEGYLGADTMYGGEGNDQYGVNEQGDKVVELANQGTDSVYTWGDITYTLTDNVENLYLDVMGHGSGNGNALDNIIVGSIHDNTLDGKAGKDTLQGLWGDDKYYVDNELDKVIEHAGQGVDSVYTSGDITYTLADNVENLYLDPTGHGSGNGNTLDNIIVGSIHDNTLDGKAGKDTLEGLGGDDKYYVDNEFDVVIEQAGQGYDIVFSTVDMMLAENAEVLSLAVGNAVYGTGNTQANTIFGNANDNILNGGGGADVLSGLGGNDTFVFLAGEGHGDTVYEFNGNGAGAGDVLMFSGYGTIAQGATFHQLTATVWQVTSANGLIQETIIFAGGATIDTTTDLIFV